MKPTRTGKSTMNCMEFEGDLIKLVFNYDPLVILKVKDISGRRYYNTDNEKYWTVPKTASNLKSLVNMGFVPSKELLYLLDGKQNAPISFEGIKGKLWPYQVAGATRLAGELNLRGILADEMGLGKTAQALAALHTRRSVALPALVICPSIAKYTWEREAKTWLPDTKTYIINGYANNVWHIPDDNELTIINYEVLADQLDKKMMMQVAKKKNIPLKEVKPIFRYEGWGSFLKDAGYMTIIMDESHKIKNMKSSRTKAVRSLAKRKDFVIAISGTPIENRPKEIYPILDIVCPKLFGSWWSFAHRYCDAKNENGWGWNFNGATNTKELNEILTENVMIRRLKKDVLKDLPTKIRTVIPVDINLKEYKKAEKDLFSFIQKMKGELDHDKAAARIVKAKEGLALIERCKQAAVVGKLESAIEWIEDHLESGRKLVVFAHHTFVLDMLEKQFKDISVRVDGSISAAQKKEAETKFQTQDNIKLFLGNIKSAGVAITLTAASDTLTLELGWTPGEHDQAEDRVHRFGQKADSVNAYYIVAKNTIEEDIADRLDTKRNILAQVLDGKDAEGDSMFMELLENYQERS